MSVIAKRTVLIENRKGLHARAAAKFVKTAAEFPGVAIQVTRLGERPDSLADENLDWTVRATSILGLMMLGAEPGVELDLQAEGEQAEAALEALDNLLKRKFDEDE